MNLDELLALKAHRPEPITVVHCGSTSRARAAFAEWQLKDTLVGKIVLTIGAHKNDTDLGITPKQAIELDILHLRKIERADEVLILNVNQYMGESTRRELEYAQRLGKRIRWLEPPEEETSITYELLCGSAYLKLETATSLELLVTLIQTHVRAGEEFDVFLSQSGDDVGAGYYVCQDQEQYAVAEEVGMARGLLLAINEQIQAARGSQPCSK